MAAAAAQISSSLYCYSSARETYALIAAKTDSSAHFPRKLGTAFATGSPLLIEKPFCRRNCVYKPKTVSIRSEQSSIVSTNPKQFRFDLNRAASSAMLLGRLAMIGFASAIGVEISTGRGLLENFGVATPLPTVALAVTVLVGILTAVFIFQSASEN